MFSYGKDNLTISKALALVNGSLKGQIEPQTAEKIKQSTAWVDEIVASEEVVYGVNTGFGPLCDTIISDEQTSQLQHNSIIFSSDIV